MLSFADTIEFLLHIAKELSRLMVLITCKSVVWSFHKGLPGYSIFTHTIEADVAMQVACMIVTICMRDDQRLMTGKEFLGKLHSNGLYSFGGQTIFVTVAGIKADYIVMRLHIILMRVLMELLVDFVAL